jgi:hypothetical protein
MQDWLIDASLSRVGDENACLVGLDCSLLAHYCTMHAHAHLYYVSHVLLTAVERPQENNAHTKRGTNADNVKANGSNKNIPTCASSLSTNNQLNIITTTTTRTS